MKPLDDYQKIEVTKAAMVLCALSVFIAQWMPLVLFSVLFGTLSIIFGVKNGQ